MGARCHSTVEALADICRFTLDHNDDLRTAGGERPHITVTVDYEMLTERTGSLPAIDGTPVDPEAILNMACDAGSVRIVTDGNSKALDVGHLHAPSRRRSAGRSSCATSTAPGQDVNAKHRGVTSTTSSTGPMEARHASTTLNSSAGITTPGRTT
jgi:hypothetical protein